jgi:ABC-type antimicrobial peptide transport system permease subunit
VVFSAPGVFYLSYIRSELVRRKSRTILTLLGLAIGVALVIVISSLSRGLDRAQKQALNPLSSIGTDLTVTLQPQQQTDAGGGPFGGGGGGGSRELVQANSSVITDLSKLGKPGATFDHTFLLPGTQLTFPASQASQIAALDGVSAVSSGLVLSAVHQQGTVPKIVARIKTGGQRLRVTGRVRFQFSAAEQEKIRQCFQQAFQSSGATPATPGQGGQGGGGSLGGGGAAGGRGGLLRSPAAQKCLPERVRNFSKTIVTPQQTLQQVLNPPQTDIKSETYSIAGVDPSQPGIGLVTPALVSAGRFLAGGDEALLAGGYASTHGLKVGSKLDLNGTAFSVVGLVKPPLGGQSADVYVPLGKLQGLAQQQGLANVVLVRANGSSSVGDVQKEIEAKFPNAQVASAKQVADQINGSLVDASNLSNRLGVALSVLAAVAAFLVAALLTLTSVGKRVRELGTLKALGWTQRMVVRQVVGESLAQGVAGGVLGLALGAGAAALIGAFAPTLTATSSSAGSGADAFGLGSLTARTVTDSISLTAPLAVTVLLVGFGIALAGGLLAGAAGAFRAARLRPADALRTVE